MNAPGSVNAILALDPATKTGFAFAPVLHPPALGPVTMGTWELATRKKLQSYGPGNLRHLDPRPLVLLDRVLETFRFSVPKGHRLLLAWEDVQFVHSRDQITLWSALRTSIWLAGYVASGMGWSMTTHSVPVGTLKKFATGNGAATKEGMEEAAFVHGLVTRPHDYDDNAIDARWILEFAAREICSIPTAQ